MGCHRRFQAIPCANSNEFAGLLREQLTDGARIATPYGYACEDQRTGIHRTPLQLRLAVLAINEPTERVSVDGRAIVDVGSQENLGLAKHRPSNDHVSCVLALKLQSGENEV
jgi:hypothetical protein